MKKIIEVCEHCKGTGLSRYHGGQYDIAAKDWKDYVLCQYCKGEGVPPGSKSRSVADTVEILASHKI